MTDEKKHSKITPPPEWLEMPKITRGVTIPTSSGLRSSTDVELTVDEGTEIPAIAFDGTAIPASTGDGTRRMLHAIDAPDVVGIDAPDVVGIDAPDVVGSGGKETTPTRQESSYKARGLDAGKMKPTGGLKKEEGKATKESPEATPPPPPEWLELPKGIKGYDPGHTTNLTGAEMETPKVSATGPVIAPSPPSDVSAEAAGPPKCPHCSAVLTRAQLDLKATGTKVLCSECFNMI